MLIPRECIPVAAVELRTMCAAMLTFLLTALATSLAMAQQGAGPSTAAEATVDPNHAEKMARGLEVFRGQVRGLLKEHCVKCHGGERIESEFDLTDRERLLKGGALGPAIVPGKSAESLLYQVVSHE